MGVVYSLFGVKPTEYQKARMKYLTRLCSFQILEASLPVFIAAGISNAARSIIEGIAGELKNEDISVLIIQFVIYASIVNITGKYITYLLLVDEKNISTNKFFSVIRKYKMSKLFINVASENSGFAWKEFFVILALSYSYTDFGWGPGFATWILSVVFFVAVVYISSYFQRTVCGLDKQMSQRLLQFDSEAAALPLSFVLTVLIVLGLSGLGPFFVSESSYLYSWSEEYEDSVYGTKSNNWEYYFLYATLLSFLVACLLATQGNAHEEESVAHIVPSPARSDFEIECGSDRPDNDIPSRSTTATHSCGRIGIEDSDAAEACLEMWSAFLSYLCGVAWFVFVVDNIKLGSFIPSLSAIASSFLGVLLLALFVTYKGPSCMASMRMRQEGIEKIQRKVAARKRAALSRGEDVAVDPAQSIFWTSLYHGMYSFYLRVVHRRKDVMIGTFRLVIGWTWEIVVQQVFHMMGATEHDSPALETLVQCVLAAVIVLLSLGVHLYIRDWDHLSAGEGEAAEEQRDTDVSGQGFEEGIGSQPPISNLILDEGTRSPLSQNIVRDNY